MGEREVCKLVGFLLDGVREILNLLLMLEGFISLNEVYLLLSLVIMVLLLIQHDLLTQICQEFLVLFLLFFKIHVFLFRVVVNLTNNGR